MIDFIEMPDGWIRYESLDGPVDGLQVGIYAVRRRTVEIPETGNCPACGGPIWHKGQRLYIVDNLERGTRASCLLNWASALTCADETSRALDPKKLRLWKCHQYRRESELGQPWETFRVWRDRVEQPSNSPTEMRL